MSPIQSKNVHDRLTTTTISEIGSATLSLVKIMSIATACTISDKGSFSKVIAFVSALLLRCFMAKKCHRNENSGRLPASLVSEEKRSEEESFFALCEALLLHVFVVRK